MKKPRRQGEPKQPSLEVAASYYFHNADKWTKKGRRQIADWLRRAARNLEELGDQYDSRFRGRYHVHRK